MQTSINPGAGLSLDFTAPDDAGDPQDVSLWTVTAALLHQDGTLLISPLSVTAPDNFKWRIHLTGAQSILFPGRRVTVSVTAVPPASAEPLVELATVLIGPVGSAVGSVLSPVPATATSEGLTGAYAADTSYFYICVSQNVWRRVAVTSW
jgi:hypothetical protein